MRISVKILFWLLLGQMAYMPTAKAESPATQQTDGKAVTETLQIASTAKSNKKQKSKKSAKDTYPLSSSKLTEEEERKYNYYYLEAIRQKEAQNYDVAYELLQHCLNIYPEAPSAQYEMAQFHLYLKQTAQAIAALEKAVHGEPNNYWYCQALVSLYSQQKEQEKATNLLSEMLERFPDKLDPFYNLLDIYTRQEKYEEVLSLMNRLEKRTGKNEQLSMDKFRIYLQMQDNKRAFKEIESLAKEYPREPRYRVLLGDAYLQNGKQEEAYNLYRQVLDEEPDNAMAMYSLASYYEEMGQQELYQQQIDSLVLNRKVDAAIKANVMRQLIMQNEQSRNDSLRLITLFDRIMEQEPDDPQLPMLYAQYLISKNMEQKAYQPLQMVLDLDPSNTAARMTLLGDAIRKEDNERVINLCEAGVESNPEMLEFHFYLAIGYLQAERTNDALGICLNAVTHITPQSDKKMVSEFYTIIGDSYHSQKRDIEAYQAYDQALQYNPDNIGALNNYAYYLSLERKNLDKAEEMSYKTVKAEPNNSTYLDTYAWILFEKGNYAEARIYIDDAIKNGGDESSVVVEHCGDIHYMTGDTESALKYWKQAQQMGNTSETLKKKIANKKYITDETDTTK